MSSTPIYLVDGSGYIFRAFYAVARLNAPDGFPTNAIFGFTRMLLKLLQEAKSSHIAVVFDAGRETFRNELYSEYKANRDECPDDLVPQMPYFRHITRALGLQVMEQQGYEADDIIATLTKTLREADHEVVIVSGDKDLMQLVSPHVSMWDTLHNRIFKEAEVKEKFGVPPEQVVEILALMGDSSDNVPGVSGIGPKTATQLVQLFGGAEEIIQQVGKIRETAAIRSRQKVAEAIESSAEVLRLSRKLVEVRCDAPVELVVDGSVVGIASLSDEGLLKALERLPLNKPELLALFERFNFTSLAKELDLHTINAAGSEGRRITVQIICADRFQEFLSALKSQQEFAFDTETTSLDVLEAKLVGASFCWSGDEAWYLPLGHTKVPSPQVTIEEFVKEIGPILTDKKIAKFGQNLKYDIGVLANHGIEVQGVAFDSMLAAYLISPDKGGYDLTSLAQRYLSPQLLHNGKITEFDEVVGDCEGFAEVELSPAAEYACQDAHVVWLLHEVLKGQLTDEGLEEIFSTLEMPLVPVLSKMERTGIALDEKLFAHMSEDLGRQLIAIEAKIYELASIKFNINSPKQLAEVLFEKLQIPTKGLKKTKTGVSTDSSVLEKLSDVHPLPRMILDYRALHKLKSTYVDALPVQVSKITGRLHTKFNQAGTGTGRLSSYDPNLQNIPVQGEHGALLRSGFIAPSGKALISADYSQIELRLLAHMSRDTNLIDAFKHDLDIHSQTARELLGLKAEETPSPEQRRIGKTINFGIVYGMGSFRLSKELDIPYTQAEEYIERYFEHFSGVKDFFQRTGEEAATQGFVRTLMGRKRVLAEIDATGRDKGFMARVAMNAPIQGSAADIVKKAMLAISQEILAKKLPLAMLLQIHDELVFECDNGAVSEMSEIIKARMEGVAELLVPLRVEIGHGKNWQEAHG